MAQAVFDEHPLEQYLREAGEDDEIMPGLTATLIQELEPFPISLPADTDPETDPDDAANESDEWRPQFLIYLFHYIETLIATAQLTKPSNPLVERFKYNVISSSLLSPDLNTPHSQVPRNSSGGCYQIPGNLPHSRTSSELSQTRQEHAVPTLCSPDFAANETQYGLLSGLVVIFSVLLSAGQTTLAMLTLWTGLAGIYYLRVQSQSARHFDLAPCLETLEELITTNTQWELIVQDVVTTLEQDERTVPGSSSSHTFPSSSLRVALHSSLQTTQTQCDNVRHLLSALTSPSDLSQLSEMYAPPSPVKPNFPYYDSPSRSAKSLSYPSRGKRRERPISIPTPSPSSTATTFTDHKRMTWNGPHSHSGGLSVFPTDGSASMTPMIKKRSRRRSDLSSCLGTPASSPAASPSAPVTPSPSSPLARVSEVSDVDTSIFDNSFVQPDENEDEEEEVNTSFAAAALKLQQSRTHGGLESFSSPRSMSPSPFSLSSPPRSQPPPKSVPGQGYILPLSPRSTFLPSSRFTSIHTPRQPLSLSALRHALQGALGAKRYACAHLLALRFTDDETISIPLSSGVLFAAAGRHGAGEPEAGYWDDVKSVMELLIGALSDAGSRLCEAMREVEAMKLRDQTPTPAGSVDLHATGTEIVGTRKTIAEKDRRRTSLSEMIIGGGRTETGGLVSFAPMPSQLSRFAGHVAAIQSALEDAGKYLEECVGTLRNSTGPSPLPLSPVPAKPSSETAGEEDSDHPALRTYEKLRRELGFALRECERGRNRLLDLVKPPQLADLDLEEEGEEEGVPGLGHDSQSDESDKIDTLSPSHSEDGVKDAAGLVNSDGGAIGFVDDASSELLLSADVTYLPPAHVGAEQVFEADTSTTSPTPLRPKSKLSREERIKLVKARRENGLGMGVSVGLSLGLEPSPVIHGGGGGYDEKWGPGGDVVQELKDVIWKVGERRRKVGEEPQPQNQSRLTEIRMSES